MICKKSIKISDHLRHKMKTHLSATGPSQKMDVHQCKKCGKSFTLKSNLVKHKKVHTQTQLHQCTLCDKSYKSKFNLSDHVKTAHSTSAKHFVCKEPQCSYSSYIISGLKNHVRKVHRGKKNTTKPANCIVCGKTFASRAPLESHILAVHTKEQPFSCSICGRAFSKKYSMKIHSETHSGLKPYKCTKCSSSFATKSGLYNHDKQVHIKARIHPCSFCDKMFITTGDRNRHIASHLSINEKLQKCKLCGKSYASLTALNLHIKVYHRKENGFPCSKCPKALSFKSQLNAHVLEVHCETIETKYQCLFCERKANILSVFMGHIQTHLRERFYCNQCPKSFSNASNLATHLKDHPQISKSKNGQTLCFCTQKQFTFECKNLTEFNKHMQFVHKSFPCDMCAKSFAKRRYLNAHIRSHLNEKPYQCSICKIRYRSPKSVNHCMDRHNNIQRFKCNDCPKSFTYQGDLRTHYLSIHADPQQRRHCCIFCGKQYVRSDLFDPHLRGHTRERPYSCEQCATEFRNIGQLNKHTKTHHKPSN
ncbi:putative zinc finger protein [Orchesella cincta]|uniref:Putative zinc finger protein n=1 Tax=Orchesella cincta TaxID=48709 RepID=A0A1D2MBQ4_ORCCI|nr:putative zinc finger protein [Orchesella cincta]